MALDEARDYLIIELVDLTMINNVFVKALNLFHLGFILNQTKINPKFLIVSWYFPDLANLWENLDQIF